jgi:hypothetical protein
VLRRSREAGRPADRLPLPAAGLLADAAWLVVGARDLSDVVAEAEWLADRIRRARPVTMPGRPYARDGARRVELAGLLLAAAE